MNRFRILNTDDFLKVIIPLLLPVLIFFSRGFINSLLEKSIVDKNFRTDLGVDAVVPEHTKLFFLKILTDEIEPVEKFDISKYKDSEFMKFAAKSIVEEKNSDNTEEEIDIGNPPEYEPSSIYVGKSYKFVTLDGDVYREGQTVHEEKILKIERDKILLSGPWGKRWVFVKY